MTQTDPRLDLKQKAALEALKLVEDGMLLGLGTGSTAKLFVDALGVRVKGGLKVTCVPTSERTRQQAIALGITVSDLSQCPRLDLTVDGADEVEVGTLSLIKGLGGALLREKLVAVASRQLAIIVDSSKIVEKLGSHTAIPVEVVPFAWQSTALRLKELGADCKLRQNENGEAFITDGGHYILDSKFGRIEDAARLGRDIKEIVGVVESGLFIGMATRVIVAGADGIEIMARQT